MNNLKNKYQNTINSSEYYDEIERKISGHKLPKVDKETGKPIHSSQHYDALEQKVSGEILPNIASPSSEPEHLEQYLEEYEIPNKTPDVPLSKRAAEIGRGVVGAVGGIPDTISLGVSLPKYAWEFFKNYSSGQIEASEALKTSLANWLDKGSLNMTKSMKEAYDYVTNNYGIPTDTTGKILETGIEVFAPTISLGSLVGAMRGASKAYKAGESITKNIALNTIEGAKKQMSVSAAVGAAVSATAIHATEDISFFEEEGAFKTVENVVKGILGNVAGRGINTYALNAYVKPAVKKLNSFNSRKEILEEINKDTILNSIYHGTDNWVAASIGNEYIKDKFTKLLLDYDSFSAAQRESLKNNIKWGKKNKTVNEAINEFGEKFKEDYDFHNDVLNDFLKDAQKNVSTNKSTNGFLVNKNIEELLGSGISEEISTVLDDFSKKCFNSRGDLNVHQALQETIKIRTGIELAPEKYGILRDVIESVYSTFAADSSLKNIRSFGAVNEFYTLKTQSGIRQDIVRALVNDEFPSFAYEKTKTASGLRQIKEALGEDEVATKIFDELKEARAAEFFESVLGKKLSINKKVLDTKQFKEKTFLEIMGASEYQDYLKELLPKDNYKQLNTLAEQLSNPQNLNKLFNEGIQKTDTDGAMVVFSEVLRGMGQRSLIKLLGSRVINVGLDGARYLAYLTTKPFLMGQINKFIKEQNFNRASDLITENIDRYLQKEGYSVEQYLKTKNNERLNNFVPKEEIVVRQTEPMTVTKEVDSINAPTENLSTDLQPMPNNLETQTNASDIGQTPINIQPTEPLTETVVTNNLQVAPKKRIASKKGDNKKTLLELDTAPPTQPQQSFLLTPREIEFGKVIGLGEVRTADEWNKRCLELGLQDFMIGQKTQRDLSHHEKPYTNPHYVKEMYDNSPQVL